MITEAEKYYCNVYKMPAIALTINGRVFESYFKTIEERDTFFAELKPHLN